MSHHKADASLSKQTGRHPACAEKMGVFGQTLALLHETEDLGVARALTRAGDLSDRMMRAGELQSEYLRIAADAASFAHSSRMVLGLVAAALSIYVCVLIYRLRQQTLRLQRRLHYEQLIAGMKAELVECGQDNFVMFMSNALNTISCSLGANRSGFVIYDVDSGALKDAHQFEGEELRIACGWHRP